MTLYVKILSYYKIRSKHLIGPALSRFVIHRHKAGRSHFDLRIIQDDILRSWSLLKEPPQRQGERRLAIERESLPPEAIATRMLEAGSMFEEEAFGRGTVIPWDKGAVTIETASPTDLRLLFDGGRIRGIYRLVRMNWYPGNRWILTKIGSPEPSITESPPKKP